MNTFNNVTITGSIVSDAPPITSDALVRKQDLDGAVVNMATVADLAGIASNGRAASVDLSHIRITANATGKQYNGYLVEVFSGVAIATVDNALKKLTIGVVPGVTTVDQVITMLSEEGTFTGTVLDGSDGGDVVDTGDYWYFENGVDATHTPASGGETDTAEVSVSSGQVVTVDVKLANDSLETTTDGLKVKYGTDANHPAAGNHTHTQLHDAVTASNASTRTVTVTVVGQAVSGAVRLAVSNPGLLTTDGLALNWTLVATKASVDSLTTRVGNLESATAPETVAVADTTTIALTKTSGVITADLKMGWGLKVGDDNLVQVDVAEMPSMTIPEYETVTAANNVGHTAPLFPRTLMYLSAGGAGSAPVLVFSNGSQWRQVGLLTTTISA